MGVGDGGDGEGLGTVIDANSYKGRTWELTLYQVSYCSHPILLEYYLVCSTETHPIIWFFIAIKDLGSFLKQKKITSGKYEIISKNYAAVSPSKN